MAQELREFVRDALGRGMPRASIREKLLAADWRPEEVETALDAFADIESPVPVPRRRPYLSAREAFFYLVLFVTLYTTAFNVGALLFQLVNRAVPDVTGAVSGWNEFSPESARGATAAIVIAFPIFLFMSRLIGRAIGQDPEKRSSKIRRWLTYLTLFISACVIIGDLTFLVTRVLSGELALRVGLKILAVLLIAGVIFAHYLSALRREEDWAQSGPVRPSVLARAAGVATLGTLVAGFLLVGSPRQERLRELDAGRVDDLMRIEMEIGSYYRDHGELPASLSTIAELPTSGVRRTRDPITGAPYGYRIVDSTTYELSAVFDAADSTGGPTLEFQREPRFWRHPVGPRAYTITIPPGRRAKQTLGAPTVRPRNS